MRKLVKNRYFWLTSGVVTCVGLMFVDWYRDRYALPSTRYAQIEVDYQLSIKQLRKIRKRFVHEMYIGLEEPDDVPRHKKKSPLKMLSTKVHALPDGSEQGIFYTLDWGGSNYRVLRIEFLGEKRSTPRTQEFKH